MNCGLQGEKGQPHAELGGHSWQIEQPEQGALRWDVLSRLEGWRAGEPASQEHSGQGEGAKPKN